MFNTRLIQQIIRINLVMQIAIGIIAGIVLAILWADAAKIVMFLGELFVQALKAVAPILVFFLVSAALANQKINSSTNMRPIIGLYLLGTSSAALIAVMMSTVFPTTLILNVTDVSIDPPQGIGQVINNLLFRLVDNPINALVSGNFIGILVWSFALGQGLRYASDTTKKTLTDISVAVTNIVRFVIRLAPLGIFGLVAGNIATSGSSALSGYVHVLSVLIICMLFVALIINPAILWFTTKRNPYPLVFACLRESGVTAFFTRSSAANIPVNLALCEKLGLEKETYAVSIPLGATINMAGAAITITILTLAAAHTLDIRVDLPTALILSVVAAVSACGASGVAGGSLLLIPLSCSLFGISNEIAMQVVAVGFVISVLQDSAETALNSSTDVVFTAAICGVNSGQSNRAKETYSNVNNDLVNTSVTHQSKENTQ